MGRRRARGRDVSGILLLDKPGGITSNLALQKVKRLYNANKAGHTGSLDPIATGVLPICLGEATKMSAYLLNADKRYTVTVKLGEKTATGDIEGEIIESQPVPEINKEQLLMLLQKFIGEIEQIPPMYSALKVDGQPLYKMARQGIEVERKARKVSIYEINLLEQGFDQIVLDVRCSKGTYIRTLAEDIGEALGCGAHVTVLRRTSVGPFSLDKSLTLAVIEEMKDRGAFAEMDECLLPIDCALEDWPSVLLSSDMVFYLKRGQAIQVAKAPTDGLVKLYGGENQFLGIGHILDDGRVAPKRLVSL